MGNTTIVLQNKKSVGAAVLLTIIFGPLGMFYTTISGGIIMSIVFAIGTILSFIGIGLILLALAWPVCIIWAVMAANSANNKEAKRVERVAMASNIIGDNG